jgi:hypothetical protein
MKFFTDVFHRAPPGEGVNDIEFVQEGTSILCFPMYQLSLKV